MKHPKSKVERDSVDFQQVKSDYLKWGPLFQRLGFKPRKFIRETDAFYVATVDGWYRLGLTQYTREELNWLRTILEYLEERSFQNWAFSWQKTLIWEENSACYLIQPWLFASECFRTDDPAAITRVAEILADLYRAGRDYRESKGIPVARDHWSALELKWESDRERLLQVAEDEFYEKDRKEFSELRKNALNAIEDCATTWRNCGMQSIHDHHCQSGTLGHGNLLAKHLVWFGNDYYLVNWEHLSFQPRIMDLAAFITDVGVWECDWIVFLLHEYGKLQPFWPEEYEALVSLLKYPTKTLQLLSNTVDFERKDLKDVAKEIARQERCLIKLRKELGPQKGYIWGKNLAEVKGDQGKFSMALSPVESWGDFIGWDDSLIQVSYDQKLPSEVIERLTNPTEDRILGGRDGNILEAGSDGSDLEPDEMVIREEPPALPNEQIETNEELPKNEFTSTEAEPEIVSESLAAEPACFAELLPKVETIQWSGFPKPIKAR